MSNREFFEGNEREAAKIILKPFHDCCTVFLFIPCRRKALATSGTKAPASNRGKTASANPLAVVCPKMGENIPTINTTKDPIIPDTTPATSILR